MSGIGTGSRAPASDPTLTGGAGGRHLFSIRDLAPAEVAGLLRRAGEFEASRAAWPGFERAVVGLAFFEPSTRTRAGFHAAAARLGAAALDVCEPRFAPGMSAPESLRDTLRVLSGYCDVLVVRHPCAAEVRAALAVSRVPVVAGGCGTSEHPTQALVDLFTLRKRWGSLRGLRVGLVGALARSRAASSLLDVLALEPPAELRLMAPAGGLPSPDRLRAFEAGTLVTRERLDTAGLDVLYVAGLPEGAGDTRLSAGVRRRLRVDADAVRRLAPGGVVLCPLPRIDEIAGDVDALPAAVYFEQSDAGLYVRMAVLEACLAARASGGTDGRATRALEQEPCPQPKSS